MDQFRITLANYSTSPLDVSEKNKKDCTLLLESAMKAQKRRGGGGVGVGVGVGRKR